MTVVRVLICEDSSAYTVALRQFLEHDSDITVVAACATAEEAIAALPRVKPDLVTMDMELPGMNGLEAIEEIMSSSPMPVLVLLSDVTDGSRRTAAALAAGALDALAKDDLDLRDPAGAAADAFRYRVKVLSRARVIHHPRARLRGGGQGAVGPVRSASVVGVCASTGGPNVLARLLGGFPADYPIPLLVVQHISAGFTEGLAQWLDGTVRIPVGIAANGAGLSAGVWIAPEGAHLKLSATGLLLDRHTSAGRHRPSGDVLLKSIAAVAGKTGVAVVLTGMGSDGAVGAAAVHGAGGLAIAQDEESSTVYGMPKAAIDLGVEVVLSPDEIAARLLRLRHEPLRGAR